MIVKVEDCAVLNVWEDSFDKLNAQTGQVDHIVFYRSLLNPKGEPPMQLGVSSEDFEMLQRQIGMYGTARILIDAPAGRRTKVFFKGMED